MVDGKIFKISEISNASQILKYVESFNDFLKTFYNNPKQ